MNIRTIATNIGTIATSMVVKQSSPYHTIGTRPLYGGFVRFYPCRADGFRQKDNLVSVPQPAEKSVMVIRQLLPPRSLFPHEG
jgi:hypothetical protein